MENQLHDFMFAPKLDEVLNFMGYNDPSRARKPVVKIAEEHIARANEFREPWGAAVEVPLCGIQGDEVFLKLGLGQVSLKSEQLPKILKKADTVVILLCTAGNRINDEARRMMAIGKPAHAMAVDAVGTVMVIDLMKELTRRVSEKAAANNHGTTLRTGPGYTGWHFDDQSTLFRFFDSPNVPITLSDGIMMQPKKSLLSMLGLTPGGKQAKEIEPCRICDLQNCAMRKQPFRGSST